MHTVRPIDLVALRPASILLEERTEARREDFVGRDPVLPDDPVRGGGNDLPGSEASTGVAIPPESAIELSLVIPAYNEQHRLKPTLARYAAALQERYGDTYEIVVIVNGSRDRTAQVAVELAQIYPQARVFNIPEAVGKGAAVLAGFAQARGARIVFADADGSTDAASLLALADGLNAHDVVIGSRRLQGSAITTPQPLRRRLLGRAFNLAVRLLFGLPYRDTQCGAKAFRCDAAFRLSAAVHETHWAFDVDLLLSAERLGLDIAEVPVTWADRLGSRLKIASTLCDVARAFWRLHRRRVAPRPAVVTGPLRVLALNWRWLGHPQAGGAELNLFEQATRWVQAGHHVTVLCAVPGPGPGRTETAEGVTIQRVGGRFTIYPLVALHLLRHGREFDRVLDVANGIPFFAPLFTRTPATLLVHHVHGHQWFAEFPYPVATVGWFLERRVVPLVYRRRPVIAVSPTTEDALVALGMSPDRIRVVYNGTELPAEIRSVPRAGHRVAYVGRIKRYKRLDLLVGAVGVLRREFPDLRLDIAGDGDARPELEELVERLGLRDAVTIHGSVDKATKATILSSATVFATPSMHEGWGLSVIEANGYGCPAVAYDVPGLQLAIRDGETGLLAAGDVGFRNAIARLLRDPALRARYSEAAKRWAAQFDWEATASDTLRVLAADDVLLPVPPCPIQQLAGWRPQAVSRQNSAGDCGAFRKGDGAGGAVLAIEARPSPHPVGTGWGQESAPVSPCADEQERSNHFTATAEGPGSLARIRRLVGEESASALRPTLS